MKPVKVLIQIPVTVRKQLDSLANTRGHNVRLYPFAHRT